MWLKQSGQHVVEKWLVVLIFTQTMSYFKIVQGKVTRKGLLGCYRYSGIIEEIRGYQAAVTPVTNDFGECITHCANEGYQFAGIIIRNECHCADVSPKIEKPLPNVKCFGRCEDNPFHNCGGFQRISLFKNRFLSDGKAFGLDKGCKKDQPQTPLRKWKDMHERSCLHYEHYSGCIRKSDPNLKLIIEVPDTFAPYFCVRHCRKGGFGYAVLNEQNRSCSCQKEIGRQPPCDSKEEESKVYITYSHFYDDVGCHSINRLPIDHPEITTNLTYLSECAIHCANHKFFGYALNATCGCERYYLSSSDRFDELCDVTCDWAPVHRCGGSNVVAVYRTGVQSVSSDYAKKSNSFQGKGNRHTFRSDLDSVYYSDTLPGPYCSQWCHIFYDFDLEKFCHGHIFAIFFKGFVEGMLRDYGLIGLTVGFLLLLLVLYWTKQSSKTMLMEKLEVLKQQEPKKNLIQ